MFLRGLGQTAVPTETGEVFGPKKPPSFWGETFSIIGQKAISELKRVKERGISIGKQKYPITDRTQTRSIIQQPPKTSSFTTYLPYIAIGGVLIVGTVLILKRK